MMGWAGTGIGEIYCIRRGRGMNGRKLCANVTRMAKRVEHGPVLALFHCKRSVSRTCLSSKHLFSKLPIELDSSYLVVRNRQGRHSVSQIADISQVSGSLV